MSFEDSTVDLPSSRHAGGAALGSPDSAAPHFTSEDSDRLGEWVAQLPIALAVFDSELCFVAVSPEFAYLVGRERSELCGQRHGDVVPDFPDHFQGVFATVLRTGTCLKGEESPMLRRDGKREKIRWELHPWQSGHAGGQGAMLIMESVARRSQFEAVARRSIKNETVATLCAAFGTEMRNLMTILSGYVEKLQQEEVGATEVEAACNGLRGGLDHGLNLAEAMSALGHSRALQPQTVDLASFLEEVVDGVRASAPPGIEVKFVGREGDWRSFVDPEQLRRTVHAIAQNSFDAMGKEGHLHVFLARATDRQLCFCIADSGKGMTDEVLRQAVDPFFTTKRGGCFRGLGLTLAYGFVTHSRGDLRIVSAPGAGTRVYITLPFANWCWYE